MKELLDSLLALVIITGVMAFKPEWIALPILNLIKWRFKGKANQISNLVGLKLIQAGVDIIDGIEDDARVKSITASIERLSLELAHVFTSREWDGLKDKSKFYKTAARIEKEALKHFHFDDPDHVKEMILDAWRRAKQAGTRVQEKSKPTAL